MLRKSVSTGVTLKLVLKSSSIRVPRAATYIFKHEYSTFRKDASMAQSRHSSRNDQIVNDRLVLQITSGQIDFHNCLPRRQLSALLERPAATRSDVINRLVASGGAHMYVQFERCTCECVFLKETRSAIIFHGACGSYEGQHLPCTGGCSNCDFLSTLYRVCNCKMDSPAPFASTVT